jgi:cold shock CspA family protein
MEPRTRGKIYAVNHTKGFCHLHLPNGDKIFLHCYDVRGGMSKFLRVNAQVEFDRIPGKPSDVAKNAVVVQE